MGGSQAAPPATPAPFAARKPDYAAQVTMLRMTSEVS
jgi:hypothetical protein